MHPGLGRGSGRLNCRSVALDLALCLAVLVASVGQGHAQPPPPPMALSAATLSTATPQTVRIARLPPVPDRGFSDRYGILVPSLIDPVEANYTGRPAEIDGAHVAENDWTWQALPSGLVYRSYLAGVKEPRIGSAWTFDGEGNQVWDTTLGGRAAIVRRGTSDPLFPDGWELDIEGAAIVRLDPSVVSTPVIGTDFRFGFPLTYGNGPWRTKFGYYHLSAHAGDEFLLLNPTFERINYVRESLVGGLSYYSTPDIRLYGEAGYAVSASGGAEPWELQFGMDYSPALPTALWPVPFAAVNCHLREEVEFGGNVVIQAGCQWRGENGGHLFRTGMEYFNGKSPQFEFYDQSEQRVGVGLWYDF
jgi:hypothetical protein